VGTFETFHVTENFALKQVLSEGRVAGDTRLSVVATAAGNLALLTDQMTYHNFTQGRAGGKDWRATF
jgi:hypothetical protein